MIEIPIPLASGLRVVVADANVLYSRALRDYLLYAADEDIVAVHWSPQILKDMADHLMANRPAFTEESARRLVDAMTDSFPAALVTPQVEHFQRLAGYTLPDDDDRDVMATALAIDTNIICTSNMKHFPKAVMDDLGLVAMTPDSLFVQLIDDYLPQMVSAHRCAVKYFPGATDASTVAAVRKAGARRTADLLTAVLGLNE